jgi:hypothetical protein
MSKKKSVLDWYGNPLGPEHGTGIVVSDARLTFRGETDRAGVKYIRAYNATGEPGDRIPLEDCYVHIEDEAGRVLYDSRLQPPADAKLLPGYIGYLREEQLKRYFPR